MSGADVDKVLSREPKLAGYDVERAVAPKTRFFTDALGVPAEKLRAAVKRDPAEVERSLPDGSVGRDGGAPPPPSPGSGASAPPSSPAPLRGGEAWPAR